MTEKNFKNAITIIGNSRSFGDSSGSVAAARHKHRKLLMKRILIGTLIFAIVAVTAGTVLYNVLFKAGHKEKKYNDGVLNGITATTPGPAGKEDQDGIESTVLSGEVPDWFPGNLKINKLGYSGVASEVVSFRMNETGAGSGIELIPVSVYGEHEQCSGVFYNTKTGEVICLLHAFLAASGSVIPDGYDADVFSDRVRNDVSVIRIYEKEHFTTSDLWIYNSKTGNAERVLLPEDCAGFGELNVMGNCLWNGRLCISVNLVDGSHCIIVVDTGTGETKTVFKNSERQVTGQFLSENLLLISDGGNYFLNLDTLKLVEVIGDYNYYADGTVFSVKNWGWAAINEIEVAAYDVLTGAELENKTVLVQTVLENGVPAFITKNTTTGEEKTVLEYYSGNCYIWSRDYSYFYVFSAVNRKLVCYSAADGEWFSTRVPAVSVEPAVIDGRQYEVYAEYAIAVSDDCHEVTLYYSRTFEERAELPDYTDEKVDSPYWEQYCGIKQHNFVNCSFFTVAYEEDIYHDGNGIIYGSCINDMETFRDVLLICLEGKGEYMEETIKGDFIGSSKLYIRCGSLRMYIWDEGENTYLLMIGNYLTPQKSDLLLYLIPDAVYDSVVERLSRVNSRDVW